MPHNDIVRPPLMAGGSAGPAPRAGSHRRTSSGNHITMTSSVASELPALGAMLAQLFEISRTLDDRSLMYLVQALCQQSEATLELVSDFVFVTHLLVQRRPCWVRLVNNGCTTLSWCNISVSTSKVSTTASANHVIFRNDAHVFPVEKLVDVGFFFKLWVLRISPIVLYNFTALDCCPYTVDWAGQFATDYGVLAHRHRSPHRGGQPREPLAARARCRCAHPAGPRRTGFSPRPAHSGQPGPPAGNVIFFDEGVLLPECDREYKRWSLSFKRCFLSFQAILSPLRNLSGFGRPDATLNQLECVKQVSFFKKMAVEHVSAASV